MSKLSDKIKNTPLVKNSSLTERAKNELAIQEANEVYMEIKKPNIINQLGQFSFSAFQQDLVNFMFWKFDETDFENKTLTLKCEEIRKLFGMSKSVRTNNYIKKGFKEISDESIIIPSFEEGIKEQSFRLYPTFKITKGSGDIILEFEEKTLNFLILGAAKYFTLYNFWEIFKLKKKSSKRIYELLVSFLYKTNEYSITVENFKMLTQCKYEYVSDVERKIIVPSLKEINDKTQLNVEYYIKDEKITFIFSASDVFKESLEASEKYQRLYEKVKKLEEKEKGIIDANNQNISFYRNLLERNEDRVIEGEIRDIPETNEEKKVEEISPELRKKIEEEIRAKIEKEMKEKESLTAQMEREKNEQEEIREIIRLSSQLKIASAELKKLHDEKTNKEIIEYLRKKIK